MGEERPAAGSERVQVRAARPDDAAFLVEMLGLAFAWRPGAVRPSPEEIFGDPSLAHYVEGWPRRGDDGVVAVVVAPGPAGDAVERPVGAAWWRFFTAEDHGFGFVHPSVPEISIAVSDGWRGQGVGSALLRALLARADEIELDRVCLSVERVNPALRLYERLGFVPVVAADRADASDDSVSTTMIRDRDRGGGGPG